MVTPISQAYTVQEFKNNVKWSVVLSIILNTSLNIAYTCVCLLPRTVKWPVVLIGPSLSMVTLLLTVYI